MISTSNIDSLLAQLFNYEFLVLRTYDKHVTPLNVNFKLAALLFLKFLLIKFINPNSPELSNTSKCSFAKITDKFPKADYDFLMI